MIAAARRRATAMRPRVTWVESRRMSNHALSLRGPISGWGRLLRGPVQHETGRRGRNSLRRIARGCSRDWVDDGVVKNRPETAVLSIGARLILVSSRRANSH